MPTEIFEDILEAQIGLLEAEPISQNGAYPLPRLRITDQRETRPFRTIILENPFLRVTLLPALGGRIVSLFDRRTSREILPPFDPLLPIAGGRRGALLSCGVQLRLDGEDRLNSLGNVATQVVRAEDDDSAAGVWIEESALAAGLGFHLFVSLPPDRAEVHLEARIANRTFGPLPYDGEIVVGVGEGVFDGVGGFYSPTRDAGFHLSSVTPFDGLGLEDGVLRFCRFGGIRSLGPRQVDAWTVRLVPFTSLLGGSGDPAVGVALCAETAAGFDGRTLRVQTASRRAGNKLILLTQEGKTLEAPADLYPEHLTEFSLADLPSPPVEFALLDETRNELLRLAAPVATPPSGDKTEPSAENPGLAPRPRAASSVEELRSEHAEHVLTPHTPEIELRRATFSLGSRHAAHTMLGIRALGSDRWSDADNEFEQALLYNASDPLLWWAKALTVRLAGTEGESTELLNAHFLAPLEPALRAEGFLSQTASNSQEPSTLLAPLDEVPEEYVEVACLLIEHGRLDEAHRWLSEAIKRRDLSMLRLLAAYCLLSGTQMAAEAAEQIRAAARVAGPPFPWRLVEIEALRVLHARFPEDAHIRNLINLVS